MTAPAHTAPRAAATPENPRRKVLIAGGGVGGLEAALALRALAGERLDIELLAPERHFTYRPLAVAEPFGRGTTTKIEVSRIAADRGFRVTRDVLDAVLTEERTVVTQDGCRIAYDDLVLALGARPRIAVPGALTFRGAQDVARMTNALHTVETDRHRLRVAFLVPRDTTWTLPLYELALLTKTWAEERKLAIDISIVTPEPFPLAAFGDRASGHVQDLLKARHIAVRANWLPETFGHGVVRSALGARVPADVAVALPMLVGPNVRGVPADALGFTPVDDLCRVEGLDGIYAVGDMAARDIKQGGLAAQQADVAAAAIAAAAGAPVRPAAYRPVLRGLLLTGGVPLYLRNPPATHETVPAHPHLSAPWWPPHKIVGRHLAPYLAAHDELLEHAVA